MTPGKILELSVVLAAAAYLVVLLIQIVRIYKSDRFKRDMEKLREQRHLEQLRRRVGRNARRRFRRNRV